MSDSNYLTVDRFARFSRTTKATLIHYDRLGLLTPVSRGSNNYRYYSAGQLAVVNVIRTLQQLGMTLEEIKSHKDNMTPESMKELFETQGAKIDQKIEGWVRAQKLLSTLTQTVNSVLNIDEDSLEILFSPAEAIILGNLNDYSRGRNDYDALLSFYRDMQDKYPNLDLNYPVWGVFFENRIKHGDWVWPDRFYFYNPEGRDRRPAAYYAVGYTRGGYGQSGDLYERLIEYIDRQGYEICGDAYEEYPLNEVFVIDAANYLMRVMITVREKNGS